MRSIKPEDLEEHTKGEGLKICWCVNCGLHFYDKKGFKVIKCVDCNYEIGSTWMVKEDGIRNYHETVKQMEVINEICLELEEV